MRSFFRRAWSTITRYLDPEGGGPPSVLSIQKSILREMGRVKTRTLKSSIVPDSLLIFLSEEGRQALRPQQARAMQEVQEEFLALAKRERWVVPDAGPSLRIATDGDLERAQVRIAALNPDVTQAASDITTLRPVKPVPSNVVRLLRSGTAEQWELPIDRYMIVGKTGSNADLEVNSTHVSRAHLLLEARRDAAGRVSAVRAEDLGSTHGTWVGTVQMQPGQMVDIYHGDVIRIADVQLKLTIGDGQKTHRTALAP